MFCSRQFNDGNAYAPNVGFDVVHIATNCTFWLEYNNLKPIATFGQINDCWQINSFKKMKLDGAFVKAEQINEKIWREIFRFTFIIIAYFAKKFGIVPMV